METVFFCSHLHDKYKKDDWRAYFSQWYQQSFTVTKKDYPYKISDLVIEEDWNNYIKDTEFNCREQWMMTWKGLLLAKDKFRDYNITIVERILDDDNPNYMRKLGRALKGFNIYSDLWDKWKYKIVVNGNYLQFSQNNNMKKILLDTGNKEIVEAAYYDNVWGIGYNESNAKKVDKKYWGQNLLGTALMEVRTLLK